MPNDLTSPPSTVVPAGERAAPVEAPAPAELSCANREASEQALNAGKRALANGDLQRAVRLLRKAKTLNPADEVCACLYAIVCTALDGFT